MKGWSDPPSHRLPDQIELQTDLNSLRRPPATRPSGEETWGEKTSLRPRNPESPSGNTLTTLTSPPPSSEF